MSGICGVVSLGGRTSDEGDIEPIMEVLTSRGPDRRGLWSDNGVILGHTLLATTPEAAVEPMPFDDPESGCVITADARLDNRDDIIEALGIFEPGRIIGDGELILRAYLNWGEACPTKLLGDFAFAIWDSRRQRLFCARDHMGMRQLAYAHVPGQAFVFATEPKAVVRHASVPKDLNEGRIADFLDGLEAYDLIETFFVSVARLPPAHWLSFDRNRVQIARFWQFERPAELRLKSDADYAEAFLSVFDLSVRARLRNAGGVSAMLSGGIDSSSVVAVAARALAMNGAGPLHTYSCMGPDGGSCPETRAIGHATRIPGIEAHLISYEALDDLTDDLVKLTQAESEPFDCVMGLLRAAYLAARRDGFKVMLDGGGGDIAFTSPNYIGRLVRGGRFARALSEARGMNSFWGGRAGWSSLGRGAWAALAPTSMRALRRRVAWWHRDAAIGKTGTVSREFARRVDLAARRRKLRDPADIDYLSEGQRVRSLAHPIVVAGVERYDRVAAAIGMEARDPFSDLRLIDFCLSLPRSQLQEGGWPKILLRRAMAGLVPEEVRWRRGKEHLGPRFTSAVFAAMGEPPEVDLRDRMSPYVNSAWKEFALAKARSLLDCQEEIDVIGLYHWLKTLDCEFNRQSARSLS